MSSRLQLAAKMRTAPTWAAPHWQVDPVFTTLAIGQQIAVSSGTSLGTPTPTTTYVLTIDGVAKPWPYTLQTSDAGKTLLLLVILSSIMGSDIATLQVAAPASGVVPGAVESATSSSVTASSFTVSCSPPLSGGTPTSYTFGYRVAGSGAWVTTTGAGLSATFSGLAANTNYEWEAYASNAVGAGAAVYGSRSTAIAGAGYWPAAQVGANIPNDNDYGALRAFTNRFLSDNGVLYTYTSLDPVTGYPTSTFRKKLWAATVGDDTCPAGDWLFLYKGASLTLSNTGNGTLKSNVYDSVAQTGVLTWTTVGNSNAFIPTFSAGTTSMVVLDPVDAATYLSGTDPGFWKAQWLRHLTPYDYYRFMDVSCVNGDYLAGGVSATATFKYPVEFSDLVTPATFWNNNADYKQGNWPLDWQIDLCAKTNKPALYCISMLSSDDCVTQFTTKVARGHPAGKWAAFTLANENWNPSFANLFKAQYAALLEVDGYLPTNAAGAAAPTFFPSFAYSKAVAGITIDGQGKVILRMVGPHGIAAGNPTNRKIQLKSFVSTTLKAQYDTANGAGTAVVLTVEDAYRVSFPTTNLTAAAEVDATTVLSTKIGFVSLNADAELMSKAGAVTQDNLHYHWSHRRQYQVAQLVRAAWAAAGRSMDECKTVLEEQVGGYQNTEYTTEKLFAALGYTTPLSQVFSAVSVGGYLTLTQSGAIHPGFGLTANELSPSGTDVAGMSASVIAQLRQMCDLAYAVGAYGSVAAWAKSQGLELWCYEIGLDTVATNKAQTQLMSDGKTAANGDPLMTALLRDWIWAFQGIGFSKTAWFHVGAGSFVTYGCFNLVNTTAQGDYTSDPSVQGAKFKGVQAGRVPPALASDRPAGFMRSTDHIFPCVLSGYDYVGNEPITTTSGAWPALFPLNNVYGYSGQKVSGAFQGLTYFVWSEQAQSVTLTVNGHNTTTAKVLTATVLGSGVTVNTTASGGTATAGVDWAPMTLNLQAGPNWVFLSALSGGANIFPHSLTFS